MNGKELTELAVRNTLWRQTQSVPLIPSENTPSDWVKALCVTDFSGRYNEWRFDPSLGGVVNYYEGVRDITEIEAQLREHVKKKAGCTDLETRVLSGAMANATVFGALVRLLNRGSQGDYRRLSALAYRLGDGGHLSAQALGTLRHFSRVDPETGLKAVSNFPMRADDPYSLDFEKTADMIHAENPDMVILGRSLTLYKEPVKEIREIISQLPEHKRPLLMLDAAHTLGIILPDIAEYLPFVDVLTASTHKTFPGPQRGIALLNIPAGSRYERLSNLIHEEAFPGWTSNHHLGTLAGLYATFLEMDVFGREYQQAIFQGRNALVEYFQTLNSPDIQVEGIPQKFATHQVALRVGRGKGKYISSLLERNGIIVNPQALPPSIDGKDEGDPSFTSPSGIRIGVNEMARFGATATTWHAV